MAENSNKEEKEEEYGYYAEMVDAWVFSDNTFGHQPLDQRDPAHTPCPPNPRNVYQLERALQGLNSLQLAHDAPISPCALDTVLEVLWQSQTWDVRAACRVLPPNGPELWGLDEQKAHLLLSELALGPENDDRNVKFFTQRAFYDLDEKREARGEKRGGPLDKGKGKARPEDDEPPRYHVVWPILVADQYGNDWVTLIWTQTMRCKKDRLNMETHYAEIQEFYIVDPRLDGRIYASNFHEYCDRRDRILQRFESLLANLDATCVVTFAPGCLVENENGTRLDSYWYSPEMPLYEHSSGERCYAVIKQWLWKLTHEMFPHTADDNATIQSPSAVLRHVNPYFERMAMLGICAWVAMGSLSFWGRVTIESLPEDHTFPVLVNGKHFTLFADELKGPAQEPKMGRSMRQLDHDRSQARGPQAGAESQREHTQAGAQDTTAHGNQANTTDGADDLRMDVAPASAQVAAAHMAARNAAKAQAPVSGARNSITQTPDSHHHQQLTANMEWMQPQLADTNAPPPHDEATEDSSGSYFDSESSDGESLGPPPKLTQYGQTMTPRAELGPDGRVYPLGTHDLPAQDKAVHSNKRPATEAPLDLGGTVSPQDKRQRPQVSGAESSPSGNKPFVLTNPFSTPSSGGGFRTPAKRGIHLLSPSPTRAHPQQQQQQQKEQHHHHHMPSNASAVPTLGNPWMSTTAPQKAPATEGAQDPRAMGASGPATAPAGPQNTATDDTATTDPQQWHTKPTPMPENPGPGQGGLDYHQMNRVFGGLPGGFPGFAASTNKDKRRQK